MTKGKVLEELYKENSKHSGYQCLPDSVQKLLPDINPIGKWEKERMAYIVDKLCLSNMEIRDIGGNTGYFSFESLANGAKFVDYFDGNITHAEFVKQVAEELGLSHKMSVNSKYYDFSAHNKIVDIIFCLNVVHHLGDDFGVAPNIAEAKNKMLKCIKSMALETDTLVLQMGFNWRGNKEYPLFEGGTKKEMLDFLISNISEYWKLKWTGVAEIKENEVIYKDADEMNFQRKDELGEFLNRPIFILESKIK